MRIRRVGETRNYSASAAFASPSAGLPKRKVASGRPTIRVRPCLSLSGSLLATLARAGGLGDCRTTF